MRRIDTRNVGEQGDEVEVLSGLKPTDQVVLNPNGLTGEVVPVEVEAPK